MSNKKVNLKFGFTLAEVLITLGIIGVVAAMTIPTLVKDYQKTQTVTQLKKGYTTLAQAVKQSEINNGNNADWDWGTPMDNPSIRQSFDTLWAPYLKISKYCSTAADCGYNLTNYKDLSGADALAIVYLTGRTTVVLADGSLLIVVTSSGASYMKNIVVDLNASKGPNTYGKDVFWFDLDPDKGLMPNGYASSTTTVNNNCKTGAGASYCATKIMRDGWEIKSDYPWD